MIPVDILWKIIDVLAWVIAGMIGVGISIFAYFHKSLERRLDSIDTDLKPLVRDMAVHGQKLTDQEGRINDHDRRISALESRRGHIET